ncbi:hypothetical protein L1887_34338 [Cichorium endivia]|nr:hypothetical protein L1887_34338 [Cichorium endivia]
MEQGYKHFSHSHNLIMHQLPEGVDVSCSGCNSSGNDTVFICWQCNFLLHEQCYRATRSLKHPSHPPHPLTLVPFPTYPSNSFYCNSCEIIGTGFSYSCANCEFDLHVQCAYSISSAASFQKAQQYPMNYYNSHQDRVPPIWNGQNSSMAFVSGPDGYQNPPVYQHLYMDPNAQYHPTGQGLAYVFIPPVGQNSYTTAQNGHSVSISTSSQYPFTGVQYPTMNQTGPSVSVPTNYQDPVNCPQNSPLEYVASVPIHTNPTNNQNPITSDQKFNVTQNIASVSIRPAASSDYQPDNQVEPGQKQQNNKGIMHFSHPHTLFMVNLQGEGKKVSCSGCEETLDGKLGYSCVKENCNFHLHESCFHLKKEIQHKSHPEHPLTLLSLAPYGNKNGEFTCNACFSDGTGFTYHCPICKFDLHIRCVSFPETVKRSDHEHMLKLYYSCPVEGEEYTLSCNVCHMAVEKDRWAYYCETCDYCTHLGCVDYEERLVDSVLDTQVQLQRLQLQMEMTRQHAQMIASIGASISSLV